MPITEAFLEATFVLWGLLIGSFLNVCIHRLPLRQSVVSPRSRCPRCRVSRCGRSSSRSLLLRSSWGRY